MKYLLVFVALVGLALPISPKVIANESVPLEYTEQQQAQEWSDQLVAYSQTLVGKHTGQCVMALRNYYSIPKSDVSGKAKYTVPNSQTPEIGSVIILNMSYLGHVGIVIDIDGDTVTYFDSNGDWRQRGAIRQININNPLIKGYRIIK